MLQEDSGLCSALSTLCQAPPGQSSSVLLTLGTRAKGIGRAVWEKGCDAWHSHGLLRSEVLSSLKHLWSVNIHRKRVTQNCSLRQVLS